MDVYIISLWQRHSHTLICFITIFATAFFLFYAKYDQPHFHQQPLYFNNSYKPYEYQDGYHPLHFQNTSHLVKTFYHEYNVKQQSERKIILLTSPITGVHGIKNYLKRYKCAIDCDLVTNMSQVRNANAVVIAPRLLRKYYLSMSFPKYRHPDQYWVFFLKDHVFSIRYHKMKEHLGSFNLTMTWRPDSDLYIGYGYVERANSSWSNKCITDILANKTGLVAWVVSNCAAVSGRETYVQELNKYIPIDIYGWCGNLTCSRGRNSTCYTDIGRHYKFYLAFENSICLGYMTEKAFRTLEIDIVPVVFGGGDYAKLLPENSYIDVLDFQSPRQLAAYLRRLDNDDQLYSQYFKWKEHYKIKRGPECTAAGFCQLCHMLHDPWRPHQVYVNISQWMQDSCDKQVITRMKLNW